MPSLVGELVQASVAAVRGLSSHSSWALEHRLGSCGPTTRVISLDQGLNPRLLHWEADSFTTEGPGKPQWVS